MARNDVEERHGIVVRQPEADSTADWVTVWEEERGRGLLPLSEGRRPGPGTGMGGREGGEGDVAAASVEARGRGGLADRGPTQTEDERGSTVGAQRLLQTRQTRSRRYICLYVCELHPDGAV
jgi:hypothetical protein